MSRTWNGAYTHFVIDDDTAYQVGTPGYVAWGTGSCANVNAPVQIEIDNSLDANHFTASYKTYIDLIRDMAKKYDIDVTLDSSNMYAGNWVTNNVWGDHTDPYGYLSRMGVSKSKLANDIKNGLSTNNNSNSGITNANGIKVGSTVKVATHATNYATGEKMSSIVKGQSYSVMQIVKKSQSKSTYRYLVGRKGVATGWVLGQDLQSNKPATVYGNAKVGNNVKVADFASKYATGQTIPKFVRGSTYKVMQKTKKPQSNSTYRYLVGSGVATGWFLGQDIQVIK